MRKADNDLVAVETLAAAPDAPWDVVCFHAQQVAEKMLKAYLVARRMVPEKTYDLVFLLGECRAAGTDFGDLTKDCVLLLRFGASSRYPGLGYEPGEEDGRAAVAAARRVQEHVLASMAPARGALKGIDTSVPRDEDRV